jgi:hypothetical protein
VPLADADADVDTDQSIFGACTYRVFSLRFVFAFTSFFIPGSEAPASSSSSSSITFARVVERTVTLWWWATPFSGRIIGYLRKKNDLNS